MRESPCWFGCAGNYFSDLGLRNARLSFRQSEETCLMENVIYNEQGVLMLNSRDFLLDPESMNH